MECVYIFCLLQTKVIMIQNKKNSDARCFLLVVSNKSTKLNEKMLRFLNMLGKCVLDRIGVMRYFVACE